MHTSTFGSAEAAGKAWDDVQDDLNEGAMKEFLHSLAEKQDLEEFVNDATSDYGMTDEEATEFWKSINEEQTVEVEVDEAAEMIAKMKSMAGVGSGVRSNHGIHEGEAGYQLTPRSIVAREMRKLQDIERGS